MNCFFWLIIKIINLFHRFPLNSVGSITVIKMNIANYSPYNKSYRFIMFQNQAYHQKNKRIASPCVKTNIRYSLNKNFSNPQNLSSVFFIVTKQRSRSSQRFQKGNNSDFFLNSQIQNSMMRSSSCSTALIEKEKRVIHKNLSYEKFKARKINEQNSQMVNRLLRTSCHVVRKDQTQQSFNKHLKYREIRKKYNQTGSRKSKMCLGNSSLLCPTLAQYNNSGMAQKFVQLDLSMSMTPSTPSRFKKRRSEYDFRKQIDSKA